MEMMRNPNAMRQAMRSQDLAMSQLENLPGGFNALRNMFETIQEPMMDAAQQSQHIPSSSTSSAPPTAPVNSALPNPWGGGSASGAANTANPFAGLGGMGGMGVNNNPFGGFGGMGGLGGMGGMGGDPAQAMAMLQNPAMQQMMQQMMQNPAFMEQVL